jgi:hypothetical protein
MNATHQWTGTRRAARWLAGAAGVAAASYAAYAATAWVRYGGAWTRGSADRDEVLDRFMPRYDVVERHRIRVAAPAQVTFAAAREMDLLRSAVARALFRGRELAFGVTPGEGRARRPLVEMVQSIGWGILSETGHEIVFGAIARPWQADVGFRALPAAAFAAFDEPGYVKIAWTLRVDPAPGGGSIFRTETRATATDASARARFRRYWAWASPGIWLIRRAMLGPLKTEAERRARGRQAQPAA